jgi:hypothetical protein
MSNIGNKRNSRRTNSRRPHARRTSISSVASIPAPNVNNTNKKDKTLQALNKQDVFPNYKSLQHDSGNFCFIFFVMEYVLTFLKRFLVFWILETRKVMDRYRAFSFKYRRSWRR